MAMTLKEIRETVARTSVEHLNTGYVVWHDEHLPAFMPRSLASTKNFNGINAVILMLAEAGKGYNDSRWMPYRESLYIKRGEKGVFVEWWDKKEKGEIEFRAVLCFNARQLFHYPSAEGKGFEANVTAARRILNRLGISFPSPVSKGTMSEKPLDGAENAYFDEYDLNKDKFFVFKRKDWHDALKAALGKLIKTEGIPWDSNIFTQKKHLSSLRLDLSLSFLTLSLGMGVPELDKSSPLGMWAAAIQENPSEIARAARDAQKFTNKILSVDTSF